MSQPVAGSGRPRVWKLTAVSVVTLIAVWLPYRMALAGNIEEWGLLGLFTEREPVYFAHSSSLLAGQSLRPLTAFPQSVAFALHPDSFALWHAMQFGALAVSGVAIGYIAAFALDSERAGVIAVVLFLVYPADTMRLSFRSLHINVAVGLALIAAALILAAPGKRTRAGRWVTAVAAVTSMVLACLTYEAVAPLVLLPALVAVVRLGIRGALRAAVDHRALAAFWLVAPLGYAVYFFVAPRSSSTYQTAITSSPIPLSDRLVEAVGDLASVALPRGLYIGWLDASRIVWTEFAVRWYLLLGTAVIGVVCWVVSHNGARHDSASGLRSVRLAVAGVTLTAAGFLPFLPSPSHVVITQRTYTVASVGGALVWLALVAWLMRRFRAPAFALAGLLVAVGFGAQLYQFHRYVAISDEQRRLLAQLIERLPATYSPERPLVVVDESRQIGQVWMFAYGDIRSPLVYLLGRPLGDVEVCSADGFWATTRPVGQIGTCTRESGSWVFRSTPGPVAATDPPTGIVVKVLPVDDVTVVHVGDRRAVEGDRRAGLRRQPTVAARRYGAVLVPSAGRGSWMFRDESPRAAFRQDFGKWGFEFPVAGFGWQEQRREPGWWGATTSAWKTAERSTIRFDIVPSAGRYRVVGRLRMIVLDSHRAGTRVDVNGTPVALRWSAHGSRFEGTFPSGVLREHDNEVGIRTPVTTENAGYSAAVDWVGIEPVPAGAR